MNGNGRSIVYDHERGAADHCRAQFTYFSRVMCGAQWVFFVAGLGYIVTPPGSWASAISAGISFTEVDSKRRDLWLLIDRLLEARARKE